jgi:nicotinamide-nucleotide amidase
MPTAEIISIGTELLLGEIVDTNAYYIARKFRESGIDLFRKTTIGDNAKRISQAIREALSRSEIVITTGGLGPTIDDATRDGIAMALNVETNYHSELWEQIQDRFSRYQRIPTENNKRQAYLPVGAIAIENPVGTAPSFYIEQENRTIIALPGVPKEMEYLLEHAVLPYLRSKFNIKETIKSRIIHTVGVGESQIDDLIGDLETLSNPTIGLAAHAGQVDIRITAKANSETLADDLIYDIETELRQRLGKWIYGVDQDTLEFTVLRKCKQNHWSLAIIESGLNGILINRLASTAQKYYETQENPFYGGEMYAHISDLEELSNNLDQMQSKLSADLCLGVSIHHLIGKSHIDISIVSPLGKQTYSRSYGGPISTTPQYAMNHSLNIIKNMESKSNE